MVLDGTVHPFNATHDDKTIQTLGDFQTLPFYLSNGRELQLVVSERTINSMGLSIIQDDMLHSTRSMTSDEIEATLIPDFERAFGEQESVKVVLKSTPIHDDYRPHLKISAYDSILTFRADIHIKNPYDESVDAAVFSC